MNEQHQKVSVWLDAVLGDESVPQYEIDEFTISKLYDLMTRNEEQNELISAVISDYAQKTEEYKAEQMRLSGVLQRMQFTPESLTQAGGLYLRAVAQAALTLEVATPSDSSLLLAMSDNAEKLQVEEQCRQEQRLSSQLLNKTRQALQQSNRLKKALGSLEEQAKLQGPDLQKKNKQAGFLTSKAKEYKKHIHSLQLDLAHNQVEPSVYHSSLLKKADELAKLKEELSPLKAKLESYHQLPPDLSLATVKVEEARRELAQLEDELSKHINMMYL